MIEVIKVYHNKRIYNTLLGKLSNLFYSWNEEILTNLLRPFLRLLDPHPHGHPPSFGFRAQQ